MHGALLLESSIDRDVLFEREEPNEEVYRGCCGKSGPSLGYRYWHVVWPRTSRWSVDTTKNTHHSGSTITILSSYNVQSVWSHVHAGESQQNTTYQAQDRRSVGNVRDFVLEIGHPDMSVLLDRLSVCLSDVSAQEQSFFDNRKAPCCILSGYLQSPKFRRQPPSPPTKSYKLAGFNVQRICHIWPAI